MINYVIYNRCKTIVRVVLFTIVLLLTVNIYISNLNATEINGYAQKEKCLMWSDEFDGNCIDENKWQISDNESMDNNAGISYGKYYKENCSIKNGVLIIKSSFKKNKGNNENVLESYSSAKLKSSNENIFKYGRFEIRARLPKGKGICSETQLCGIENTWPKCGEIDIFEGNYLGIKNNVSQGVITDRFSTLSGINRSILFDTKIESMSSDYHIYGIEWGENKINYFIDGHLSGVYNPLYYSSITDKSVWPFDNSFQMRLDCVIGHTLGGEVQEDGWSKIKTTDNIDTYEDYMFVDYVRVYSIEKNEQSKIIKKNSIISKPIIKKAIKKTSSNKITVILKKHKKVSGYNIRVFLTKKQALL